MPIDPRILQVKVSLAGARPPIWRRVLLESSTTLAEFHHILQWAMGWTDSHLHQFEAGGVIYGRPDPESAFAVKNERTVRLGEVLRKAKDGLRYEYDFGDDWLHEIVLEKIISRDPGQLYPWVAGGKRACPPEDCGGIYGYYEKLAVLADPAHPDHQEISDWIGENFDPQAFSADALNRQLHRRQGGGGAAGGLPNG